MSLKEFIIIVCEKTTKQSLAISESFRQENPDLFIIHHQKLPFLGGAIRDAFLLSRGSHVIMMASDLETDPETAASFISESKNSPEHIITGSRWIEGGGFEKYNFLKWILNWMFQKFFSALYGTALSDMTYGYRIFPTELVKSIEWEELQHSFLFETILKPLQLGIQVKEIPCFWRARKEGKSQNSFFQYFGYFKIGIKARFYSKTRILKTFV